MTKKILCAFIFAFGLFNTAFAADNMRIFQKENGEVITGLKIADLKGDIKVNIAFPQNYNKEISQRFPVVFLLDTEEYSIETLNQMFYPEKSKNPQAVIASFRFENPNLTQEQLNKVLEEMFPFFEMNYRGEIESSKRIILAKNSLAILALNSLNKASNYFLNLGIILDNTTAFPQLNGSLKKNIKVFCFSVKDNILRLQDLLVNGGLEPIQNFFFNIQEETSFGKFDLRYFLGQTPKIEQINPVLPKTISQEAPISLQVKTNYGSFDFFPTQIRFSPPILAYDETSGSLQVLLKEASKVKIKGVFSGKKWSKSIKISK